MNDLLSVSDMTEENTTPEAIAFFSKKGTTALAASQSTTINAGRAPSMQASFEKPETMESLRQERDAARLLLSQLVDQRALKMKLSDGHNLLFRAIREEHEELTRWLAPQCDPFELELAGNTALTWAIQVSAPGCVRALLESVADPVALAAHSGKAEPALHCAARESSEMVQAVLPYADPRQRHTGEPHNRGLTALMAAAQAGRADSMAVLLPLSDVNAQTEGGWSALTYSARNGNLDCVKMLLEAPGADPHNRQKESLDAVGQSVSAASAFAAKKPPLWTHPAALMISENDTAGLALFEPFVDFNLPMFRDETPLLIAALHESMDCLGWLLNKCRTPSSTASAGTAGGIGENSLIGAKTLVEAFEALLNRNESREKGTPPRPHKWPVLDELGAKMAFLGGFRAEHELLLGLAWIAEGGAENESMPLPKIRASREAAALKKELSQLSQGEGSSSEGPISGPRLRL